MSEIDLPADDGVTEAAVEAFQRAYIERDYENGGFKYNLRAALTAALPHLRQAGDRPAPAGTGEIERFKALFDRYGDHDTHCDQAQPNCSCGMRAAYREALSSLRSQEEPTRPAAGEFGELIERLLREEKVDLRDIVAVRALFEKCAENAGEAATALNSQAARIAELEARLKQAGAY